MTLSTPFDQLPDVKLFEAESIADYRGIFLEGHQVRHVMAATGTTSLVRSDIAVTESFVVRGLHYQVTSPQGKLIRCLDGQSFHAVVDMRHDSPSRGHAVSVELDRPEVALWVPPGFATGYFTFSRSVIVYEVSAYWHAGFDRAVRWNDPTLDIDWPVEALITPPLISDADRLAPLFRDAESVMMETV